MRKIPSLFQRNYDGDRLIRDEVTPGCEWVIAGEGRATRKWDGTCCMIRDGRIYRRYEVKPGKMPPTGFEPAGEVDERTGKQQGWLLVGDGPADRWHREALARGVDYAGALLENGTYELCGPKVQGNPERQAEHVLMPHGGHIVANAPRTFAGLREYLAAADIEGIVWHHPDGRMCKIKTKDFGRQRGRQC